jgi:UDP-glucose 4-epimerase
MDLKIASEQHGLDYCIIRPHNVYGIKQNIWDRYRNVLGIWMYNLMNGGKITVFGDGSQKRAFTYMDDINEPLWESVTSPKASKEIINVGGPVSCTILEAAETLQEVVGYGDIEFLENRHEVKYAWSTHEKSEEILGYSFKTNLKDGLKKMWDWAQKQPERPRQSWDSYELDKGIYDFWKNK